jgi:hypothetical protein
MIQRYLGTTPLLVAVVPLGVVYLTKTLLFVCLLLFL